VVAVSKRLEDVLRRLGKLPSPQVGVSPFMVTSGHGLDELVGSDVARTAIPAESQNNAVLLDAAAGHIAVAGTPPNEYVFVTQGMMLRSGAWQYESGVTTASACRMDPGAITQYFAVGPGDPNNGSNWHLLWQVDGSGNTWQAGSSNISSVNVSALAVGGLPIGTGVTNTSPGYLRLGPITIQWGYALITTGAPPVQTAVFIGYPAHVNQTLVVMATPQTTDDSLVWLSTSNYGQNGFTIDVFRTNLLGGTPGPLNVLFTWFAVCQT